ncbi:class I SAM-dependent methyltransferase [Dehalococcoidia bacterium]|nr:class I SAM-dependent methyltransferase [Dehalococcoidia bacterium]
MAKRHYQEFCKMLDTLTPYTGEIKGKRILDIGCGQLYSYTLLLHNLGNTVTGIDIVYVGVDDPLVKRYWRILRRNGWENFLGRLLYGILLKGRTYYQALKDICDFPLTTQGVDVRQMSVEDMLFPDETFDIVISIAVFEHLPDVSQAVSEIERVMKTGGLAYISIHLFTSPSGGHHYNWQNTDKVPPWDHLRQRKLPLTTYLNGLREEEYLSLFREKFEILRVLDIDEEEGKALLTPEIRAELKDYAEEELLKHGIIIIARKR